MFTFLFNLTEVLICVLVPLQITFETIYLSKDWPNALLKNTSFTSQVEKQTLQLLLLKYWGLVALNYILMFKVSPINTIVSSVIPFVSLIKVSMGYIVVCELIRQFIKFIEEQDKIISLIQNSIKYNDINKKSSAYEYFSNIIFTTININNKDYIASKFLFGNLTKNIFNNSKKILMFNETNYINAYYNEFENGVESITDYFNDKRRENGSDSKSQERRNGNHNNDHAETSSFSSRFWDTFTREYHNSRSTPPPPPASSTPQATGHSTADDFEMINMEDMD